MARLFLLLAVVLVLAAAAAAAAGAGAVVRLSQRAGEWKRLGRGARQPGCGGQGRR